VHYSIAQSKILFPLLSAALQDRLTDGLFLCKNTDANLLLIQMGSDPEPVLRSTGLDQADGQSYGPDNRHTVYPDALQREDFTSFCRTTRTGKWLCQNPRLSNS